jgi:hypothetical protein
MQQGKNSQISRHPPTTSDSPYYLEGHLYGLYYKLTQIRNKSVIMVVVDHLSKYAHFCTLHHPFTASTVAQIFMDQVFKLHGMPHSIVSDLDPTFTSNFWQELFKLQGTQLHLSLAYHP